MNNNNNNESTPLLINTHTSQRPLTSLPSQSSEPHPFRRHYSYQNERQNSAASAASTDSESSDMEKIGEEGFANEYLKSIVYGGLDSVISSLGIVTSVAGGHLGADVIIVLGVSKLLGDSISMATGDAMSSQAELDYNLFQREKQEKQLDRNGDDEFHHLVRQYEKKGMSKEDADNVLSILSKYPDVLLDHVMTVQAGLPPPDKDHSSPIKEGAVTMLSFIFFGSIPLLPYLLALIPGVHISDTAQFVSSMVAAVVSLFTLGAFKGHLSSGSLIRNGLLMSFNGSIAGALGYIIGYLMGKLIEDRAPPGVG
jgi:VIT1/CCC1 family predicted Fe2+/Mn2+ transporter